MIVKMAVKETPALPGRKLKQHYFKVKSFTLQQHTQGLLGVCMDDLHGVFESM